MEYKLYTFFRSSASYRVRIALNLKGIEYESVAVHLRKQDHRAPEYLRLNPLGLVPMLEHENHHIPQSLAIIEYLDERVPEPPLLPGDAHGRAIVRAMAQAVACDIHPICNLRVLEYLRSQLDVDEDGVNAWYRHWVAVGLEGLEGIVAAHRGAGPYCFGGHITLADVCLVPQLYNARRFSCDLTRYSHLLAVDAALQSHPAFAAALPERQPDAAPS
jgi:maleylacetoacetate isomerase